MLERISSRELTEWIAYYELEPFGEDRADLRSGIVAAITANANRDPKKTKEPYTPQDFMPFVEKPEPTEEEIAAKIAARFGAR